MPFTVPSAASAAARAAVAAMAFPPRGTFPPGGTCAIPLPRGHLLVIDCTEARVTVDVYPPGGEGEPLDSVLVTFAKPEPPVSILVTAAHVQAIRDGLTDCPTCDTDPPGDCPTCGRHKPDADDAED